MRIKWGGYGLALLWVILGAGSLFVLANSMQNSSEFSRLQPWILLFNVIGVLWLTALLARKLWQLIRAYREHVPGSRLTARTVAIFGTLVIVPLIIVYLFSLDFLNRGIDSWFQVEVKQGLNDAVGLSRSALDQSVREYSGRIERFARSLVNLGPAQIRSRLAEERRATSAIEIAWFASHQHLVAVRSGGRGGATEPIMPSADVLRLVRQGRPYASLDPLAGGQFQIRIAVPLSKLAAGPDHRYVFAVYGVPSQLSALSEAVQHAYSQYGELALLRKPLKTSFELTLTVVLLIAMLAAIHLAIFSAQRLTRPVQDLIAGTRAVGKGDFATRLPLPSRDEMGFLVHSFNDMTKRLSRARAEAERSRQAVEHERERLAVILARLSTGVLVVDRELTLGIANQAAGSILGVDLTRATGCTLSSLTVGNERVSQFVAALAGRFAAGREEWREQIDLDGATGQRALMCACTPLPGQGGDRGYVIVFDDITALLQAQRDAAWGEVARRLAHEIKNPLTPIQLSAERLRRRLLRNLGQEDAEVLGRSTDTIVQQVESMKQMVNAFTEYARAPAVQVTRFSLNELVREVAELHRSHDSPVRIQLSLARDLPSIDADRARVRQILNNLLVNAFEALGSSDSSWVEITTQGERIAGTDHAVITVSDNGPGFKRDLVGRVFDPYVTSKPKGTGLGLAIVKKIVEEHGGSIDADNRPEGGARVRVVLPLSGGVRPAAGVRELRPGTRKEILA